MFKYLFHHIAVEWNVKLSHLCCYCQKHKTFWTQLHQVGGEPNVKSVHAPVIISVSTHHKQCDSLCEIQHEGKWGKASLLCDASLSFFPSGPPINVCSALF